MSFPLGVKSNDTETLVHLQTWAKAEVPELWMKS